jgi:hypothetical protein
VDDTGVLTIDVPATWTQTETAPAANGNPLIIATPDRAALDSPDPAVANTAQGVKFQSSTYEANPAEVLQFLGPAIGGDCVAGPVEPYDDSIFVGVIQFFRTCGGTPTTKVIILASPATLDRTLTLIITLPSEDDPAFAVIQQSFNVIG